MERHVIDDFGSLTRDRTSSTTTSSTTHAPTAIATMAAVDSAGPDAGDTVVVGAIEFRNGQKGRASFAFFPFFTFVTFHCFESDGARVGQVTPVSTAHALLPRASQK